jgi:hypothetical protein
MVVTTGALAEAALPTCFDLAIDPAFGLAGNPEIADLASDIIPADSDNATRCEVTFTYVGLEGPEYGYQDGQTSEIGIRVGLPLSEADGGMGGVQGDWNGKVMSLGNGGFAGRVTATTPATNSGYAGTGSDTGHSGGSASFGLNDDGTVNLGKITDYGFRGQRQANLWGRMIAETYYGQKPTRNYWQGCSDGGREGHEMLQRYGDEFDGILTISPAIYWTRWGYAGGWPNYVANALLGTPGIDPDKYAAVNDAARAQCDPKDGITDGSILDTRVCDYDAKEFVCKNDGNDPANCLTPEEAIVVNASWHGPSKDYMTLSSGDHTPNGPKRVWSGWQRGTNGPLSVAGTTPNLFGEQILRYWVKKDSDFDWRTLSPEEYLDEIATVRELFGGYIGSDSVDLTKFRKGGGKMIATYGNADQVIPPNGIYHYYNRLMRQYQGAKRTQEFYRLFIFPDASHCRGAGMDRDDLFLKLVDWVENGVEPDYYVAQVNEDRTRKVCMYPNTMVYDGSGDINDEASFYCQVNKKDDPHLIVEGKVTPLEKPDPVTTLGETSKHSKH